MIEYMSKHCWAWRNSLGEKRDVEMPDVLGLIIRRLYVWKRLEGWMRKIPRQLRK